MVQFQKMVKNPRQKWYHFRIGSNILNKNGTMLVRIGSKFLNKNGTISEKGQKSSTKMVPFQKRVKNPRQKWYHSSTKMVPFQKRVKHRQKKWYHFSQKRVKIAQQKWYHFRKRSKIVIFTSPEIRFHFTFYPKFLCI